MFLFLRLLLAHFIADFPLQTDALYRIKVKGFSGQFLHGMVVGICMLIMGFPFLGSLSFCFFIFFIVATHILQDMNKISFNKLFSEKENIWIFLLDQILHIAFISLVIPLKIGNGAPALNLPPCMIWYYSNTFIFFLAIACAVSFGSIYLIPLIKSTFLPQKVHCSIVTPADKWYGTLERLIIFTSMVSWPLSILITVPLAVLCKILYLSYSKKRLNTSAKNEPFTASLATTALGLTLTIIAWTVFVFLK